MSRRPQPPADSQQLRAWLEYVIETAIDLLDEMDAAETDLEDDEIEDAAFEDAA